MELAYTLIFFIFVYNWFSRYNFISLILFMWTFNSIRNVRNYIVKNKIENSSNPFLCAIKSANDFISWSWDKLVTRKNNFWFIEWIEAKYIYLNTHFIELLEITKQESMGQFSSGFNYTLTSICDNSNTRPKLISSKSVAKTNKDMFELNKEMGKKNSLFVPLNLLMGKINFKSINNLQDDINKINTIIKDLDSKNSRISLYDSDEDNERIDTNNELNERIDTNNELKEKIE